MMMCNILFAAAISFLPYFEARNSLALRALSSETDVEGGENDAVPTLPDMTKRVKCISCKGHGVLNLKEEDLFVLQKILLLMNIKQQNILTTEKYKCI